MPRYFDPLFPSINANFIKPMVKIWGGSSKMTKYECIDFIITALQDPAQVQAAIARLEPWERSALAILKGLGGVTQIQTLTIGLFASGLHPQRTYNYEEHLVSHLFHRGLVMENNAYALELTGDRYSRGIIFCDERILAQVGFPSFNPIQIKPMPAVAETRFRRPSTVSLDIMGMMHALENMGGLNLTLNGFVRVSDQAKLRKAMHWDEKGYDLDGLFFPNPVDAWLGAFSSSNLLKRTEDGWLVLSESPERYIARPFGEQVRLLMEGLIRTKTWWETPLNVNLDMDGKGRWQGRLALTLAMSALPLNPDAFFSLDDFEQALFNRIGLDFSLRHAPSLPTFFRETPPERQQILADLRVKIRNGWMKQEGLWLKSAFTTWLYFLGLVELALENGQPSGFRLTETGWTAFHPELTPAAPAEVVPQISTHPAWVVQPNFDIIAYLDHASPVQLAFLERHAGRTKAQVHTAQYRLTRESVYRGLQNGSTLADILEMLQAGSQTALPQNVLVELREWASLCKRLILHRRSRLVEFPTEKALQAGLAQGLAGRVLSERFLLLDEPSLAPPLASTVIDYAKPLPKNLTVTESGTLHLKPGAHDLITPAQLSQWADPKPGNEWQLSAGRVAQALRAGSKITDLLTFLQHRLSHRIPNLLDIALRSWAGEIFAVEMETVILLRCPRESVFQALITSPMIIPTIRGSISPDLIFVKADQLETLRQHLGWLGLKLTEQLQLIPIKTMP